MPIVNTFNTRGVGSPEGKVAAPVGSTYTDTAATNGAVLWVKASGTGSTGWRDDYGDITTSLDGKVDEKHVQDMLDTDPRIPKMSESPEWSWAVTDGDSAALGVTMSGDTVIPRIDTSTRMMLLDTLGPADALHRSDTGLDIYPWRVTDEDGSIPLAVREDGAIDFRRLTPEAAKVIHAHLPVPDLPQPTPAPSSAVWVADSGTHATHVETGQRYHLGEGSNPRAAGDVLTWQQDGVDMWRTPEEGPWHVADLSRFSIWGSSSTEEFGPALSGAITALGAGQIHEGGKGYDRAENILARMGADPYVLQEAVEVPATGPVTVSISETALTGGNVSLPGRLGDVRGTLRMVRLSHFEFTSDEGSTSIPAGAQFIPDDISFRDAPTLVQIGKNDVSDGASPQFVFDRTVEAYEWLRTLPRLTLVMGHHANTYWGASHAYVPRIHSINAMYQQHFGPRYVDLLGFLTSPEIWDITGITPTADDLQSQADGLLPLSLSRDSGAHFNEAANQAIATHLVAPHLKKIGWY